jgi:hypothetical protein
MPASSAEKCMRQRANKLKSTQTPKIMPPSAQSTDSTSALTPLHRRHQLLSILKPSLNLPTSMMFSGSVTLPPLLHVWGET